MRRRLIHILILALCALLVSGAVSAQQYKRDYKTATDAIEEGKYAEAIEKLKSVISENPNSVDRLKIYGMLYLPYLPHYYLGQAYLGVDDCESALGAWQAAINAGVINSNEDFSQLYSQMQSDMKTCKTAGIDISSLAAETNAEITNQLDAAIGSYQRLQGYGVLARDWSSRYEPLLEQAKQTATRLRQQVTTATQAADPDALARISAEAKDMANRLNSGERDALAQVETLRKAENERQLAAMEAARNELDAIIREAGATEKPSGGSAQMNTLLTELNRQVGLGQNLGSTAPEANIRQKTQEISNVLRRYRTAVQDWQAQQQSMAMRTPPNDLKRIAEAFFSGDYETTVGMVRPEDFSEDRARIQALLFRAAANHKLYVRGGEQSREILRQIQVDIQAIKRMNSNFSPYIAAFSPKFLTLFRQT
jgi:tetratricopeptide (TPR) repeat protein